MRSTTTKLAIGVTLLAAAGCRNVAPTPADPFASAEATPTDMNPDEPGEEIPDMPGWPNIKTKTLGGKQFWADRRVVRGWRIQRHALTGHHRLLDARNRRAAWGTWEDCLTRFDELRAEQDIAPVTGRVVIVLHGLFRTRSSMASLAKYLKDEGGYEVINVGYPTTRATLDWHAQHLADVIDGVPHASEINFVGHSLGNLVVRHYLGDQRRARRPVDPRIHRMVMLGPPNNGAEIAEKLVPLDITRQITGPSAQQLARSWDELAVRLATPECEFGILAGGGGSNPLVAGSDDWVVTVESTRLAGAQDFRELPVMHTTMMNQQIVQELTLRFLQQGFFETEALQRPIAAAPPAGL